MVESAVSGLERAGTGPHEIVTLRSWTPNQSYYKFFLPELWSLVARTLF